jgi:hypothetical protein
MQRSLRIMLIMLAALAFASPVRAEDATKDTAWRTLFNGKDLTGFKPREWNTMKITAKGGHVTVVLNGKKVADYKDEKPEPKLLQEGVIGFQTYGADGHDGWVKLREMKIREY